MILQDMDKTEHWKMQYSWESACASVTFDIPSFEIIIVKHRHHDELDLLLFPCVYQKMTDLQWAGITIDEGPGTEVVNSRGPYVQSERVAIYKEKAEEIVDRGGAYKCFCTEHRLELMRKDAARRNEHFRGYDNR